MQTKFSRICSVGLFFAAWSCGSSSPTAPGVMQVAGTWNGTLTLTTVSGGECVGVVYNEFVGYSDQAAITFTQSGNSLATVFAGCSYAGTAGSSSFTLNSTACDIPVEKGLPCQPEVGGARDMSVLGQAISGTVIGNDMSMTMTETDNILFAGTNSSAGTMTLTFTFRAKR
jgi:hypothetical protein